MTSLADIASLAAVFRAAQHLCDESQRWYTETTGDVQVPAPIVALRNALCEPNLQRLVETLARAARAA